jgi:hypothetical protein
VFEVRRCSVCEESCGEVMFLKVDMLVLFILNLQLPFVKVMLYGE